MKRIFLFIVVILLCGINMSCNNTSSITESSHTPKYPWFILGNDKYHIQLEEVNIDVGGGRIYSFRRGKLYRNNIQLISDKYFRKDIERFIAILQLDEDTIIIRESMVGEPYSYTEYFQIVDDKLYRIFDIANDRRIRNINRDIVNEKRIDEIRGRGSDFQFFFWVDAESRMWFHRCINNYNHYTRYFNYKRNGQDCGQLNTAHVLGDFWEYYVPPKALEYIIKRCNENDKVSLLDFCTNLPQVGTSGNVEYHQGTDLVAMPNTPVRAKKDGTVIYIGIAYPDTDAYASIHIDSNDNHITKYVLVTPIVKKGDIVRKGDIIGHVQNITARYKPELTNHYHLEVRDSANKSVNPRHHFSEFFQTNPQVRGCCFQ